MRRAAAIVICFGLPLSFIATSSAASPPGSPPQSGPARRPAAQSAPSAGVSAAAPAGHTAPTEAASGLETARAAYDRGDCAAALAGLEAASAARPEDAVVRYQLGFCLDRLGQTERAKQEKRRAAAQFEKEAAAGKSWEPFYYLAALAGLDLADPEGARTHAQEGLQLLPSPEKMDGVACFKASRMAGFAGRPDDALVWMRRAAERFAPQSSPPPVYAGEAFLAAGEAALEKGEDAKARDWLERAATISDGTRGAWYLAGVARLRLEDAAGALADFRRLNEEPERTEAQYAVRLLERIPKLEDLPAKLPDGREVAKLSDTDLGAALRPACGGEWKEASRPAALALLAEKLRRGQTLRETALANGCVDFLFR